MTVRLGLLHYFRQRDRGLVLTLLAAVCLAYLPFLGSPLVFDDTNFVQENFLEHYSQALFRYELRWLPNASLIWTYSAFGDVQTHVYHLTNMLLHAAIVVTLFYFLRKLVEAVVPESINDRKVVWGSWFAALIFAVHPVMVYAAGYVIERSILMATLFVLMMQLAYLRGLLTGQKRWLMLAVATYFLAGFSKEHSVMAPALLLAETILLRGKILAERRALVATWLALAFVGVQIILLAKGVIGTSYEEDAVSMFAQQELVASGAVLHLLSVLTQAGLFFKYLLLLIVPNPAWMSIDMHEHFVSSLTDWQGWLGMIGFVSYGAMGVWLLLRPRWSGLAGLAVLSPWILFLPEFSTVRVQEVFVLYRSYLWLPGIMLLIPIALAKWPGKKSLGILGVVVLMLLPLTLNRLWVFADNYRLWNDAAKLLKSGKESLAVRIYYNRALAEAGIGMWAEAAGDYERTIEGWKNENAVLHHDLGVAYYNLRRYQDALAQFDKAIVLEPVYPKAYFDKGYTLKRMGQDKLAMQQMIKSCELGYKMACLIVKMDPTKK
jgi:protein O-mannosyl-transferase